MCSIALALRTVRFQSELTLWKNNGELFLLIISRRALLTQIALKMKTASISIEYERKIENVEDGTLNFKGTSYNNVVLCGISISDMASE